MYVVYVIGNVVLLAWGFVCSSSFYITTAVYDQNHMHKHSVRSSSKGSLH